MKCFYHSADLDGHCSGAIIKMVYPDCKMIGINYGDDFPWKSLPVGCGEKVFMVDFSLQPYPLMRKLAIHADPLIWIDHHKSAIEECWEFGDSYLGIQRSGIGACQLVWEYLKEECHFYSEDFQTISTEQMLPTFVKLLAEYDVWNHTDPRTLPFQYGIRQYDTSPENQDFWEELLNPHSIKVEQLIIEGELIIKYENSQNEKYCSACAFDTELDGLKCIAVNKMLTNSRVFDSVWNPNKYHAMLTFGYRKGQWTVSLYSTREDIDVSAIAKARGGGGHKGASGFQCKELPFILGV